MQDWDPFSFFFLFFPLQFFNWLNYFDCKVRVDWLDCNKVLGRYLIKIDVEMGGAYLGR